MVAAQSMSDRPKRTVRPPMSDSREKERLAAAVMGVSRRRTHGTRPRRRPTNRQDSGEMDRPCGGSVDGNQLAAMVELAQPILPHWGLGGWWPGSPIGLVSVPL